MTATAPGWYPDPADDLQMRWWDGGAWSHETMSRVGTRPAAPSGRFAGHRLGRGWARVATALETVLRLLALGMAALLVLDVWAWRMVRGWRADPSSIDLHEAELLDSVAIWSMLGLAALTLACLVLFIVWLYRAHRSDRMDRLLLRHGSGWAIGAWFVPVLNLWRPAQMVLDVRRGASGGSAPEGLVRAWWWALLGGVLLRRLARLVTEDGPDQRPRQLLAGLEQGLAYDAVASGVLLAAAVLGALVVRSTSRLVATSTPGAG